MKCISNGHDVAENNPPNSLIFNEITIGSLNKAKKELRTPIINILEKDFLNRSFAGEESILAYIEQVLDGNLSLRERDLILKYSADPAFR